MHTAGSGDPVVFLHGAGGLEWDAFLDGLAERFTVYAPEHPGTTPGDPDGIKPSTTCGTSSSTTTSCSTPSASTRRR